MVIKFSINSLLKILTLLIVAIFSCLTVMLLTEDLLTYVVTLEGYNLSYILFLYVLGVDSGSIKRLLLLSMLVFAIMAFGLCTLSTDTTYTFGKLLIFVGILFKLGVVPFHTWVIDIYEHSPFGVIAITDGIFKVILATIFIKLVSVININFVFLIKILGYISLAVSSVLVLRECQIKRWLGCLSIGHIGVVLCTISEKPTNLSIAGLVYMFASGLCVVILCLAKRNIFKTFAIFAIVGLPPFHTFFAKLNLIEELLRQHCICELSAIMIYFIIELISAIRYIKRTVTTVKTNQQYI